MTIDKTACIFGHRKIAVTEGLLTRLQEKIEELILCDGITTFLFGSKSEFDDLCYRVVSDLKNKYSEIERIYVRAEFPYISDSYKAFLLKDYEGTYYPQKILGAGRASYVERNYEMIDNSSICIVYCDENYLPSAKVNAVSGTKIAYAYALRKNKRIINLKESD